jgi:hypothetical protein
LSEAEPGASGSGGWSQTRERPVAAAEPVVVRVAGAAPVVIVGGFSETTRVDALETEVM